MALAMASRLQPGSSQFLYIDFSVIWASVFRDFVEKGQAVFILVEMLVFLGVLLLGWFYCLKRGAFQWD